MEQNLKNWLISGVIFIIAGAILLVIMLMMSFSGSDIQKYCAVIGLSLLAGYLVIKILNKTSPIETSTLIFAVYTTIITGIIIGVTKTIVRLDAAMNALSNSPDNLGVTSMFGVVNPIYSALAVFIGLNVAYWHYYAKHPDKQLMDFVPHLCGLIIMVAIYLIV
jgi:hypothetical protein